jgi:uncharacterized membrane protein YqjE
MANERNHPKKFLVLIKYPLAYLFSSLLIMFFLLLVIGYFAPNFESSILEFICIIILIISILFGLYKGIKEIIKK